MILVKGFARTLIVLLIFFFFFSFLDWIRLLELQTKKEIKLHTDTLYYFCKNFYKIWNLSIFLRLIYFNA